MKDLLLLLEESTSRNCPLIENFLFQITCVLDNILIS